MILLSQIYETIIIDILRELLWPDFFRIFFIPRLQA